MRTSGRSTGMAGGQVLSKLAVAVVVLVAIAGFAGAPAGAVPGQPSDPLPGVGEVIPAPATTLSPDGRSATDGVRTLTVSQAADLDPAGQQVTVTGSGYDDFKGVYIAFCMIPPTDQLPSPCGGGIDMEGVSGSSHWISSNAPPYGDGLAVPYGPDGSFETTVEVRAEIGNVDCRRVRCAVVSRNDHVRSTDRSQDIFVPLSFAAEPGAGAPGPVPTSPPDTAPATTTSLPDAATTTAPPPTTAPPDQVDLAATSSDAGGGGGAGPWIVVLVVVLVAGVAAGVVWQRRSRQEPGA